MRRVVLLVGVLALATVFALHVAVCVAVVLDVRTHPGFVPDIFAHYNVVALLLTLAAGAATWFLVRRRPGAWTATGLCLAGAASLDFLLTAFLAIATLKLSN